MKNKKSIKIDNFIENYKRTLTRNEKFFEIAKDAMFSG